MKNVYKMGKISKVLILGLLLMALTVNTISVSAYTLTKEKENKYTKVTASTQGYIKIDAEAGDCTLLIKVYDKNKNEMKNILPKYVYANKEESVTYGVKKGTYYVYAEADELQSSNVKITFNKTNRGGTSKSKATTVSASSSKTGSVATDSVGEEQWYKIQHTQNGKLNINIDHKTIGSVNARLYAPSGVVFVGALQGLSPAKTSTKFQSSKAVPKGTYYIMITTVTKTSTGSYKISYK